MAANRESTNEQLRIHATEKISGIYSENSGFVLCFTSMFFKDVNKEEIIRYETYIIPEIYQFKIIS